MKRITIHTCDQNAFGFFLTDSFGLDVVERWLYCGWLKQEDLKVKDRNCRSEQCINSELWREYEYKHVADNQSLGLWSHVDAT